MLIGYIHGVAVVLIIGQLGKLLGLDIDARDPLPQLVEIVQRARRRRASRRSRSRGVALAILLPLRFLAPRFPAPLVVVVVAIVASSALDLAAHGVAVVGAIPAGLPALAGPDASAAETLDAGARGDRALPRPFADGILTARSYAGRHGQHVGVDRSCWRSAPRTRRRA